GIDSVAVLPFTYSGGDANLEFLGDGLTEQILNNLAQLPSLRVTARPSVFMYKGQPADPKEAGQKLGVRAVVMGRIAQQGGRVTVQVDLVDAVSGAQIWGRRYESGPSEVQSLEREISAAIGSKLRPDLTVEQQQRVGRQHTASPEAYRLYLEGLHHFNAQTLARMERSSELYRQAIDKDPGFALAQAGLADAYSYIGFFESRSPLEIMPLAKAAAQRALRINPNLGEAHTSLGIVQLVYDFDAPAAEASFRRATELAPGNAYSLHWHAHYLETVGRTREGLGELQKSLDLDPISSIIRNDIAFHHYMNGRDGEAIDMARTVKDIDPGFPFALSTLGLAQIRSGLTTEAIASLEKALALAPGDPQSVAGLVSAHTREGRREEARKHLESMLKPNAHGYVPSYSVAVAYAGFGDRGQCLRWLERAFQERSVFVMLYARYDPRLEPVRDDPRYVELLKTLPRP
ncbi:MAG: tetratricopeptide repeat protein, partial [Bryobacteraceae bacterium]